VKARLRCFLPVVLALVAQPLPAAEQKATPTASLLIVGGAGGEKPYDEAFARWVEDWRKAGAQGGARTTVIGADDRAGQSIDFLRDALRQESVDGPEPLWLVLLGHGTADSQAAKFNLRGEDLSAAELAGWLAPMRRPVIIVAGFSSSGAFLAPLSAAGRIVVTATKSGGESNYARFGGYLATAIADAAADLDHDGQTSLLEAWLAAARQTADFYASDGRLATEHSLLDDNGDGRGTPPHWFQGLRAVKKAGGDALPDGARAHQLHLVGSAAERELTPALRARRDAIETELARLRAGKADMQEQDYFGQLEAILLRLAQLYRDAKAKPAD
jgi:hypothetical protein